METEPRREVTFSDEQLDFIRENYISNDDLERHIQHQFWLWNQEVSQTFVPRNIFNDMQSSLKRSERSAAWSQMQIRMMQLQNDLWNARFESRDDFREALGDAILDAERDFKRAIGY